MNAMAAPESSRCLLSLRCMEIWGGNTAVESRVATPGLEAWVYSLPFAGSEQGGDVHYVSLCGGGVITRAIVADVSGHGASVGELAASLRVMMRKNINRKDPTRLVRDLNRQFTALGELSRFATAVVATYLATKRRLTLCNAGHPRPLWYRARERSWVVLTSDLAGISDLVNLPLGLDDETAYDQFSVPLGKGDVIVLYTDALVESGDGSGKMLGEEGLLGLARGLDPTDPSRFGPSLLNAIARHRGGLPADDDTTMLVLHHNGLGKRRLSIGEKLDVYAKVFGLRRV